MTLEYQGYAAGPIDFDADERVFSGTVLGLRDVIHFEGTSADELAEAFRASIDQYLSWCAERGEEPERPYSGNFTLRVSPELHRRIAIAAARAGKSLNGFLVETLERSA